MFDLGLIGGWAAGGPAAPAAATNAQTPASASASANADATSLAAAFGDLMQALAGADAPLLPGANAPILAGANAPMLIDLPVNVRAAAEEAAPQIEPATIAHPRLSLDREPQVDSNEDKDNQDRSVLVASWWPPEPISAPAPAPRVLAFTGARAHEAPAATASVPAQREDAPMTAPTTAPMIAPTTAQLTPAPLAAQPAPGDFEEVAKLPPSAEHLEPAPFSRPVGADQSPTRTRGGAEAPPYGVAVGRPFRAGTAEPDQPQAPPDGVTVVTVGRAFRPGATAPHVSEGPNLKLASIEPLQRFMVSRGEVTAEPAEAIEPTRETAAAPAPKPHAPVMPPHADARHEFTGSTSHGNSGEQSPLPKSFVPFRPAVRTTTAPTLVLAPVPYVPVSSTSRLPVVAEAIAPATPADTPDNAGVAPQIVSALRLAWSRGSGEAHIRLDPGQFGDVSVSIRVEAGQVVARIQAESPVIREWLQTNHRALQESLAQHDLKLARLDVAAPSDDARDASRRDERDRRQDEDAPHVRRMKRPATGPTFEFETVA